MAIRRTPVIRTRKRRILLIHPLGTPPTILACLQVNRRSENQPASIAVAIASDLRDPPRCVGSRCFFTIDDPPEGGRTPGNSPRRGSRESRRGRRGRRGGRFTVESAFA
jgi:hypothetical protein